VAKAPEPIVAGERLRDQVYRRLRDDLQSGAIAPGARLVETQLAQLYGVSRTPIREVLLQLSREGLLKPQERGYLAPVDTQKDILDRLEARRLLDAQVARHAALEATAEELKALDAAHDRQVRAHAAGRAKAFVAAHGAFRAILRGMCKNLLLQRCAAMVDDAFQVMRGRLHQTADNRALTLQGDAALLAALQDRNPDVAEAAVAAFVDQLLARFLEGETKAAAPALVAPEPPAPPQSRATPSVHGRRRSEGKQGAVGRIRA
jgi:DNA-binding GntR family transcriptional regulator